MTSLQFESHLDSATFRNSQMFGGVDLMSARFVRHSFAPHTHEELMIGVIHAGVKSFRRGRSREYAGPGSVLVVNAGEMHTGAREHGRELIYSSIYLPDGALQAILPRMDGDRFAIRQSVIDDHDIWNSMTIAHKLALSDDEAAAAEEAVIMSVSLLFDRYGASRLLGPPTYCPKAVNRAVEFLQARACDHVSLEDASKASDVGVFHLIRLFQKHLGLTPYAYLTQIRITKSRELLRLGRPVAQVALDVGFADQAHFTKRFKQLTGTTPALYARSMQ
jgi:AraC-like DNA-binding protein